MGDLTLFEALTGGAFDRQNGNIAGNLTKIFQKSQMPRVFPGAGGGMGGFGIDRYIKPWGINIKMKAVERYFCVVLLQRSTGWLK